MTTDDKPTEDDLGKRRPFHKQMLAAIGKNKPGSRDHLEAKRLVYEDRVVEYMCKNLKVPTSVRKLMVSAIPENDARRLTARGFSELYPNFPLEFDVTVMGKEATPFSHMGTCFTRFVTSPYVKRFQQLQEENPDVATSLGLIFPFAYVQNDSAGMENPANAAILHDHYRLDRDIPGFYCVWHPPKDHEIRWPLVFEPLASYLDAVRPVFEPNEPDV